MHSIFHVKSLKDRRKRVDFVCGFTLSRTSFVYVDESWKTAATNTSDTTAAYRTRKSCICHSDNQGNFNWIRNAALENHLQNDLRWLIGTNFIVVTNVCNMNAFWDIFFLFCCRFYFHRKKWRFCEIPLTKLELRSDSASSVCNELYRI